MTEQERVKTTPAKGSPILAWVRKYPLTQVIAFLA